VKENCSSKTTDRKPKEGEIDNRKVKKRETELMNEEKKNKYVNEILNLHLDINYVFFRSTHDSK
jgi:hypothetical protein